MSPQYYITGVIFSFNIGLKFIRQIVVAILRPLKFNRLNIVKLVVNSMFFIPSAVFL